MSTSAISPASPIQYVLPDLQERAIAAISNGASLTAAAALVGVHRNTVNYWRRSNEFFRAALLHAQYDRALLHREHAEALADTALTTVREILTNKDAAPSVRLRAALAILETASTPPPEAPPCIVFEPGLEELHKDEEVHKHEEVHKNAQTSSTTYRREEPKTGRNEICPCGSGLKFKRCCLNKPPNPAILEVDSISA